MTLWIALSRQRLFRSANPMFQIARGALLAFSSAMAFAALRRHAGGRVHRDRDAHAGGRHGGGQALALKEQVSRLRWALVVGGFLGALIVVRWRRLVGWAALPPLAATFSNTAFQTHDQPPIAARGAVHHQSAPAPPAPTIATPPVGQRGRPRSTYLLAAPAADRRLAGRGDAGHHHLLLILALGKGAPASTRCPSSTCSSSGGRWPGYVPTGCTGWLELAAWRSSACAARRQRVAQRAPPPRASSRLRCSRRTGGGVNADLPGRRAGASTFGTGRRRCGWFRRLPASPPAGRCAACARASRPSRPSALCATVPRSDWSR